MSTLLLIYVVMITLELILSLVLAIILLLILAPPGASRQPQELAPRRQASLSPTLAGSLRDAFSTVSRGDDDLSTIVHARHMLAEHAGRQQADPAVGQG